MNTAKMAEGIIGKKRSYPSDAKEESNESNEVEKDEQDTGDYPDMHSMNISRASNGFSVHVHSKGKQSGDMPGTNSQEYVFSHDHPVKQHIHAILKHTKHK